MGRGIGRLLLGLGGGDLKLDMIALGELLALLCYDRRPPTMMRIINDVVRCRPVVVMPVEGQGVARLNGDGVRDLLVAEDVASHVDRVEVFDGGVGVSSRGWAVVCWCSDSAKGALVDAVEVDALWCC